MRTTNRLIAAILMSAALLMTGCQSAEDRAAEHYQNALTLISNGQYDQAIVEFQNVFKLNGAHIEARRTLAQLYRDKLDDPRAAYSQYLRLVEQNPDDLEGRTALAEMAFLSGRWEDFDRHGKRAMALAPEDPAVKIIAVAAAYRKAADEDAAADMRDAANKADALLAEQPDNMVLRTIVIDAAIRNGDTGRALSEIDKLLAKDPDDKRLAGERLKLLIRMGDREGIEKQLRDMVERFPDEINHKKALVQYYLADKNLDAAEAFLRSQAKASALDDPGPTVDLIRFLADYRSIPEARTEVDKAIAERNDPAMFQVIGAGLDFAAGNRDSAVQTLTTLLATAKPSKETRNTKITLAKMLMAMGDEAAARARVQEVLDEDPANAGALKMQAAWMLRADDTDGAITALRTVLDQAPEDAEAMTLMADVYGRAGRSDLARDFLALAVDASGNAPAETIRYTQLLIGEERYSTSEELLIKALRLAPEDLDLLQALGRLYLLMKDYPRADGVVKALRRIGGESATWAANGIEAEKLAREGGRDEVIAFIEQLSNEADASLASRIALVQARISAGDARGGLDLAEQLQAENPENADITFVVAAAQMAAGQLLEAEKTYRGLIESGEARPVVWRDLFRIQMAQGEYETARATLAEGLKRNPENFDLLWIEASVLEQEGNIDRAIEIYTELYEQNSSAPLIANNLASLLATYRNDAESLQRAWVIARRFKDADMPAIQDTYGWILERRGQSAEALPYLESAARALGRDPLVRYHLGKTYLSLTRTDQAVEQFRAAVEIAGPSDQRPQIEEARSLLQTLQSAASPAPMEGSIANPN